MTYTYPNEIWADIIGYENLYSVSNLGRIVSHQWGKHRILRQRTSHKGYLRVNLSKNGQMKTYVVHQLVAKHFLENPQGLTEINHKDENKLNNNVNNLEWCTRKYNVNYGTGIARQRLSLYKPVVQYDEKHPFIASYDSIMRACRETGIDRSSISRCCRKRKGQAGGYKWRYETEVRNVL